jgi:hypothetical protein
LGLHVAKYPVAAVKYDWHRKFGIDVPAFGGLSQYETDLVEDYLGGNAFGLLTQLSLEDEHTVALMEWIDSKPDMSDEDVEAQIRRMDMSEIEHTGFQHWEVQQHRLYDAMPGGMPEDVELRIHDLRQWAEATGHLESPEWVMKAHGQEANQAE